jgi:hypothetical protein
MTVDYDGTTRDFPVAMDNVRKLNQTLYLLIQCVIHEVCHQARYI